ncbi:MAG: sulfide/dihydroorotate dehydrogenase-like FAD/NAD-binding protein [Planctomycetaceae bacterium]
MFEIVEAAWLAENVRNLHVLAPRVAKKQQPGQFVIVRVHEHGERIPLTIAGSDPERGTIRLIVQGVGKTTRLLNSLDAGQFILDVVGPLGKPSEIRKYGTVVVVAGGVGAAIAMPTAKALKQAGNHVQAILGARNKDLVILEDELRDAAHELFVMTDDGSYGQQGLVTDKLQELIGTVTEMPERGSPLFSKSLKRKHRSGAGDRSDSNDAGRGRSDSGGQDSDDRQSEFHHGGRNGHVRRMSCDRRRRISFRVC